MLDIASTPRKTRSLPSTEVFPVPGFSRYRVFRSLVSSLGRSRVFGKGALVVIGSRGAADGIGPEGKRVRCRETRPMGGSRAVLRPCLSPYPDSPLLFNSHERAGLEKSRNGVPHDA